MTLTLSSDTPFFDVQVNGVRGVDFSDPNLTFDDVRQYCHDMDLFGIPYHVPTIITAAVPTMVNNVAIIRAAMKEPWGKGIMGIHLEGPYLDPTRSGAHPRELITAPSIDDFNRVFQAAEEQIIWTTMSPRILDGEDPHLRLDYIRALGELGVVVSIGHHAATADEVVSAVNAGATGLTHFGNAMSPERRILKEQSDLVTMCALAAPHEGHTPVTVMLVPDGEHVPLDFIKAVAILTQADNHTKHGLVFTSDQSPLAGAPKGVHQAFGGQNFEVIESTNTRFLKTEPLSGSYLDLRTASNWLLSKEVISPDAVARAVTINPIAFLKVALERTGKLRELSEVAQQFLLGSKFEA